MTARLVELDPRNAGVARRAVAEAGPGGVEVVVGDAARTDHGGRWMGRCGTPRTARRVRYER